MGPTQFSALGRYAPNGATPVDLIPFSEAQFPRTQEDVRQNLHRQFDNLSAGKIIDGTQQHAEFARLKDGSAVLDERRGQGVIEERSRIVFA
ncbi:hypothetical protein ACFS32_08325 [Novosphingobium pokkalii]|uniref:hypothetical protein n=1 Tax=Novosphingobium pokkalii TaxID=1770194 RepID=UPI00199938DB|nr:hypothetical protein GCM10019060_38960 [Novosphingobium pokkalii]